VAISDDSGRCAHIPNRISSVVDRTSWDLRLFLWTR
jgi:hypothetical protein